jgi:hypothetical protein
MNYKKNIRFKVEAKTGKLVRRFNVKLVVEIDENDKRWFSHIDNPKREIGIFYEFLNRIFSRVFKLIITKRSQIFEKVYSSKFNLNINIYTKNEMDGKEIIKYYIYVGNKYKNNKIHQQPRANNLLMIVPTNLVLGLFQRYKDKKQSQMDIVSELTGSVLHEMTHVLDPLAAKLLRQEMKNITQLDLVRVEGLTTFQEMIYAPKKVINITRINPYHQSVKRYFSYNLKQAKDEEYYFGLYMCLVMFTYFIKNKNKVLYKELYEIISSGNPKYQILLTELRKEENRKLSVIFKQIISQQDAKTFFKKFYETAIILGLNLDCLEEIKDLIKQKVF